MEQADNLVKVDALESPVINIREILLGRPTRLRYVVRFSICPRVHDESVAEHSFYTAYIAMMIAVDIHRGHLANGDSRGRVDIGLVVSRALMHDMDESYSGDFIRMFKHSSPEVKNAIDSASEGFMKKFTHTVANGAEWVFNLWKEAKDTSIEGLIVSLSDFLSVVSYVVQEINAGNHNMFEHLEDLRKFYETFHDKKYDELRPYIEEAGKIIFAVDSRRIQIR